MLDSVLEGGVVSSVYREFIYIATFPYKMLVFLSSTKNMFILKDIMNRESRCLSAFGENFVPNQNQIL